MYGGTPTYLSTNTFVDNELCINHNKYEDSLSVNTCCIGDLLYKRKYSYARVNYKFVHDWKIIES